MRKLIRITRRAAAALAATLALSGAGAAFGGAPGPAATPEDAMAEARPLIDAARAAKSEETPEIVKGIRRAVDVLKSQLAKGRKDVAYATMWNEALTVSRFHANTPPD